MSGSSDPFTLEHVRVPDEAVRVQKLKDLVHNQRINGRGALADQMLLIGLMGIVAELEAEIAKM